MQAPYTRRALVSAFSLASLLAMGAGSSSAQDAPSLVRLQFDIVGVRLVVDPPALTVPRNIPTEIKTSLVIPSGITADVSDALAALTAGAVIEAQLHGPSIPATTITVPPGSPIPIPALALAGEYFLDGIRLAKNGATILDATGTGGQPATTIPITVINDVFVTSVTSRPLSSDEIRQKGILIDQSSFQTVSFQVAFNVDGQKFTIEMPAVLPTPQLLQITSDRQALIQQVAAINQRLAETQTTLPPEFDRPGINFSIAALPFFFVPEDSGGIPSLDVPPITGLVVIAGNVAFLHQFFKVAVMVSNVAPDGSQLALRDVTATLALPVGLDGVPGTPDQPGDDPLRLARIGGGAPTPTTAIVQAGPDGQIGTADDIPVIPPQKPGEGDILLEGLKEGGHTFDVEIDATLEGLPSGPVKLTGHAAGSVFVRNPTFAVTLAHPRTIRSGETYQVFATITNTSRTIANLVSVNLDPLSISGAQLVSDRSVSFASIAAGESATATFTLLAQRTGDVTFSSVTGDVAQGGGIQLFTGVGERGVPLAPNAIVLPDSANALPPALIAAAQRVLGQAFSIATAPADALPDQVLFVKRQTVIDRGVELAQAGERVQFGEPLGRVLDDLLLDWLGNSAFDPGFDQLLRTTDAGTAWLAQVASLIGPDVQAAGALEYQRALAQTATARPLPHMSVVVSGPSGIQPAALTITRADGTAASAGASTLPGGIVLPVNAATSLGIISVVEAVQHVIEIVAPAAGTFDLGIVVPGQQPGTERQLRFPGMALRAGGVARVIIDPASTAGVLVEIDSDGDGVTDSTSAPQVVDLAEETPHVLAARQLESSFGFGPGDPDDPATYGLLVGVLFDKPVTQASAELTTAYSVDSNTVVGAALQHSGRLVYLYLQKPIGGLKARSLSVTGVEDLRGTTLGSASLPIATVLTDGAHVFGQVREAGGQPVANAILRLTIVVDATHAFDAATIQVDGNGGFDFDFVPRIGQYFTLTAQHPLKGTLTSLTARIRGAGEQLLLNPTFTGRGTVRGRLIAVDGATALPDTPIALIPGSVLGTTGFAGRTNGLGEFVFTDVPVGIFTLTASDGVRGFGQAQGLIATAGQVVAQDLTLVAQPSAGGSLVGRVFLGDGATPASGFTVYVGSYDRQHGTIAAVDSTQTDTSGNFAFARTLPEGSYDVVAVDAASQQIGSTRASVSANLTSSVSIVLEATGAVEGVVFNAQGQPVAGAVIAGGLALGTADATGFFRIEGVPGGARTIQAGDPVTKRRGEAAVTVVPGQTVRVAITLESRATITGRVLDAGGHPMPRVSVRIPEVGGFRFVFTNQQGVYTFPDLSLGSYLIEAPGPSVDSLIDYMQANGMDPLSAFTSGDASAGLGGSTQPAAGDENAVLAAYQQAAQSFVTVDPSILGLPMASVGGFGFTKVELFQDSTTAVADLTFLSQGRVAGRTENSSQQPTAALVRVVGLSVSLTGAPTLAELGRMTTDPVSGTFAFTGIPRFDLTTFQTAGVRGGDFTLDAAQPFSPTIVSFRDQLNTSTPDRTDIDLRFPSAADTNGTLSGQVFLPDGTTPAPANTQVQISFGDLTVVTADDGTFHSLLPIPSGVYTVTATAPGGLQGRATAVVPAGGNGDIQIRLLGLGSVTVLVRRPDGTPVANAQVRLDRSTFPFDEADGQTDAAGSVHFVNITEGPAGLVATEALTGLMGRASGSATRDTDVSIPLTITASGRVTGRFVSADGSQAIPFAQVVLTSGSVQAFGTTDATGAFELLAVPIGAFTVEANDPLTGRVGRATDDLTSEGQTVDVTIRQLPRGSVAGVVLNADGATPVPAARVRITSSGATPTDLQATAGADGGFRFDGVPQGDFTIVATDPLSGFAGAATGRITIEGEFVGLNVTLAPFGAIDVLVHDPAGQPVGNATVTVVGPVARAAAVDQFGRISFEHLPLGSYTVTAVSLADSGNGGRTQATIVGANQRAASTVTLRGTGVVSVTVVNADGITPVPSAQVTLDAKGASSTDPAGPTAGTLSGFTDAQGVVTLTSVPVGDFTVRAEAAALGGVSAGTVPAPGSTASVTVRLGAAGSITGRVLLPDGVTPAAQAIVTLHFQSQTQLQSGVLQRTTGLAGTFAFSGIPLGTFTVSAFEVVSNGVRNASGLLSSNGQTFSVGDLILDNTGPRVTAVDPSDRSSNASPDASISVTFDEAVTPGSIQTGTLSAGNLVLLDGTTAVALAAPVMSNGNRTVSLRPVQPLRSGALYTLSIKGGADGPQNESGLTLPDPFVSTFAVRDVIPPAVVSVSPAPDSRGVLPDTAVRITFSEPAAGATIVLRDASGAIVPGATGFTAGNTVAVFSAQNFLLANTFYTVTLSNVTDVAGNALAGGVFTSRFFTVDTLPPVITALQISGAARAGAPIGVLALVTGDDVARVEFRTTEGAAQAVANAPFAASFTLPTDRTSTTVSAVAVDLTGNRSAPFEQTVTIQPNAPPVVTLTNLSGGTDVRQGQTLTFQVHASDDAALAQILFSSVGAASSSTTQAIPNNQADFTGTFTVQVPLTAATGQTLTVQAAATDNAGLQSSAASLSLPVRDGNGPVLSVVAPVNNAVVVAGQSVDVIVDASDDVAVATLALVCNPAASGCESRAIGGPGPSRQTFTVSVPASLQAPASLSLSLVATDTSGNTTTAGRVLQIADAVKPVLTALQPVSGSSRVVAGATAAIRAQVSDNVGVTAVSFTTEGALVGNGSSTVSPPLTAGFVTFNVAVPPAAPNGSQITVRARAHDAANNASDEGVLVLTVGDTSAPAIAFVDPAAGTLVAPGQSVTIHVHATDDVGVQRVNLSVSGVLTAADSRDISPAATPADVTFVVAVPAGTAAGPLTLAVEAIDAAGTSSGSVQRVIAVMDTVAPQVRITSPLDAAAIDPRTPLVVTVEASDAVGVAQIVLSAAGAVSATTTRAVAPPSTSRVETFTLTVSPPPAAGGTVALTATATDGAGNIGNATPVNVRILDVVPPDVATTVPADGATKVDTATTVQVHFTEPMDEATLTALTIVLRHGGAGVPVSLAVNPADDTVTLTPLTLLAANTSFTIDVGTGAHDRAGNPLSAARLFTFTTASPDTVPPKVSAISPADQAVDASLVAPVVVTFSEAIDPASVTASTFSVRVGSGAIAGALVVQNGNTQAVFTPAQPFPTDSTVVVELTAGITDRFANALVAADGSALTGPLAFTFGTGRFSLTSPSGPEVVENASLTLEARASATLGVSSVLFTVNGQPLPVVGTAPFVATFSVGSAASIPSLTIVASGRNTSGDEIVRDERTFTVTVGLKVSPTLSGVPIGGSSTLQFAVSSALSTDLPITLTAGDPTLVTFPVNPVVLPAGQTRADVLVQGVAVGATAVVGHSSHGDAGAIVAVSPLVAGETIATYSAPVGTSLANPANSGFVVLKGGGSQTLHVTLLAVGADTAIPVSVVSTNTAVATATAGSIGIGDLAADVQITAVGDGVALLIVRAGDRVLGITVIVGVPPPGSVPVFIAPLVGASISNPPLAGQVVTEAGRQTTITVALLSIPAGALTPVSVTSSDPSVATAVSASVQPGQTSAVVTITAVSNGVATLIFRVGGEVRGFTVFVGTPPAGATPIVVARPVGMSVVALPTLGRVFAPAGAARTTVVRLFPAPVASDTVVTIATSDPSVVSVNVSATVHAGEQDVTLDLVTGPSGAATITLEGGGLRRELTIVAGDSPTPGTTSPVVAAPVGITVIPNPTMGRLFGPLNATAITTLAVPLLEAPVSAATTVTITSGDPSIALVGGRASMTASIAPGEQVLQLTLSTSGAEGASVITFEFNGVRREVLVIVGNPPASGIPAVTAPVVGVRIGG